MNTEKVKQTTDQITAAYALNLWTVSISQIIDYNDVNVLEQEYETIMNNLNLYNMPKDKGCRVERCSQRRSHLRNGKSGRNGRHSCNAGRYRIHELPPQSSRL